VVVTFGRTCPAGYLPAFSVDTEDEAKELIVRCCEAVWVRDEHGGHFGFIAQELEQEQTLERLYSFGRRLAAEYSLMRSETMTEPKEPKKPKQKTKKIPFDKVAVEVDGQKGVWEWECGGVRWRYSDGDRGINLEARQTGDDAKDDWHPLVHVSDIKSAGLFSEGFSAGYQAGAQAT
jgi:hypothetical protein